MPIEQPKDNEDLPKLLRAEAKEEHSVSFNPNLDIDVQENDKGWNCYMIEGMMVEDSDDEEVEGTNEIPFWTMKAFAECFESMTAKHLKKDEVTFTYVRKDKKGKNTGTWEIQ